MNKFEVAQLLAKIKIGDNREINELVIAEWHDTVHGLLFADAIAGVTMHRQESSEYLQPVHVMRNVRRIMLARVEVQRGIEAAVVVEFDPRPDNFDAMAAVWADPVGFAREVAVYDRQLVAAGREPTVSRSWREWER